ncbi:MAG: hypothetical protein CMH49_03865 [Myxococcales bacterium]|nr:hypothetical protein [Myxococcales bacterium]
MPNFRFIAQLINTPLKASTFACTLCLSFTLGSMLPQPTNEINSVQGTSLTVLSSVAEAKKKKKRRKKRYDRRQREAKKLIDAGHPTIEITLKTSPRVRASVYHGKELLGTTPLRLVWPKDTGSLDIKLKASGYLTVNSRLYTHRNDRVTVNMFKVDQAHLLFGYKKKVKESPENNDGEK